MWLVQVLASTTIELIQARHRCHRQKLQKQKKTPALSKFGAKGSDLETPINIVKKKLFFNCCYTTMYCPK